MHTTAPKLDARRISLSQDRGSLYHGAFSVNLCVYIPDFISHRWKDMGRGEENAV